MGDLLITNTEIGPGRRVEVGFGPGLQNCLSFLTQWSPLSGLGGGSLPVEGSSGGRDAGPATGGRLGPAGTPG